MWLPRPLNPLQQKLPGTCQICARWPAQPICQPCATRYGAGRNRCTTCALPLGGEQPQCGACLTRRFASPLSLCLAAVDYAYPWDTLIARFKFRGEPALAQPLAQLMLSNPAICQAVQTSDMVVPIPVTPTRLAERGYNQAWELAKALLQQTQASQTRGQPMALMRVGQAPDQHDLPAEQRIGNLKGAFMPHPDQAPVLRGARLLLVDDVSTTGTTLRAAAGALLQAGAREVCAVVLARTAPD